MPGAVASVPYEECAERLAISEGAVKMAVQRLRRRYRQILRSRIADTLANTGSVDEEIRYLLNLIGS